ncbi:hypothetical protein GGU11DRAFT_858315 [Lentinula aff. detonsa]|uniref:Uncharacterized protein n=1 Tax=Lentinula aff. detonsa TaxID=2804958 RepID=A0AA38KRB3_9AGAR|nr:hypothetical protein GGU10DRAFT_33205 [Lentinula aff. detonsa]KAJ3792592.1 hypothetical protein GGU11DRAFT_858315 [Lentinula aff. detonsa]
MFVPYCEQAKLMFPTSTQWLSDTITKVNSQRGGISYAIRKEVWMENDQMKETDKQTMVKHCVPWIRISRQLVYNLRTEGDQGKGMTRADSIGYLNWLMDKLGMDENMQIKLKRPTSPPENDQLSYDEWFSWAMDTICDWPKNLFQGPSAGDGGGTRVDLPAQVGTTPALKQRVQEAREELAMYIKGLSVEPNIGDDPPKTYEIYVPGPEEYYIP